MPADQVSTGLAVEELFSPNPTAPTINGVVVANVVGFDYTGSPCVAFVGNPSGRPLAARSTIALSVDDVGRQVALSFERGDPARPIVLGTMWNPESTAPAQAPAPTEYADDRIILTADKELVLKCGKSSIVLTKEGKVLLRGEYVLSRSAGINRIKGGSVQIN